MNYAITSGTQTGKKMKRMAFTFSSYTTPHEGHLNHNEDTILVERQRGLAAVLDGVGGVEAGEVASQLGAKTLKHSWQQFLKRQQPGHTRELLYIIDNSIDLEAILCDIILEARQAISDEGDHRTSDISDEQARAGKYPETTLVMAVIALTENNVPLLTYAHVGDSRLYLCHTDQPIRRLTQDDSYFLMKIKDETITLEDAVRIDQATHSDQLSESELAIFKKRNGITQCLGHISAQAPEPDIHLAQTTLVPGDILLLCSDGIHDNLIDTEIEQVLRTASPKTAARQLVKKAIVRSHEGSFRAKQDDMSAIVITYS